jgi:hypothetical protein
MWQSLQVDKMFLKDAMNQHNPAYRILPVRPRLVLRVGFAGSQRLLTDSEWVRQLEAAPSNEKEKLQVARARATAQRIRLEQALPQVLHILGHRLAAISPNTPVESGQEPAAARFYSNQCPLLRLCCGLCQGADVLAVEALGNLRIAPGPGANPQTMCLETELAAVLPFDVETYRRSRPAWFHPTFDRHLSQCAWVLALDGRYAKPNPDTPEARNHRARAYRAQSAFLLRHSDVVIVAADPDEPGLTGGTLETAREALAFELPVVLIHTGRDSENVILIEPGEDFHAAVTQAPVSIAELSRRLNGWVNQITADPDSTFSPDGPAADEVRGQGVEILREFFDEAQIPQRLPNGKRRSTVRELAWTSFYGRFEEGPTPPSDLAIAPYQPYRQRATDLNYHYIGKYRGAFLVNYTFAVVAVALATFSLALLGLAGHTAVGEEIAGLLQAAGHLAEQEIVSPRVPSWLLPLVFALGLVKLVLVSFISRNTRRANAEHWNDRAVDYRYLAERLRGMYYLPLAGSNQPPIAQPPQFASRVVRQSFVDWLFDAIVRSISPAELPDAKPRDFLPTAEHDGLTVRKLITPDSSRVLSRVRDGWLTRQADYHQRNSRSMRNLDQWLENSGTWLSRLVVAVVLLDLLLITAKIRHWLPEPTLPYAKGATLLLIFLSAVLPAIVAALGGFRFQSECQRLAERSAVMRVLLRGRKNEQPGGRLLEIDILAATMESTSKTPDTDPGSWNHAVLRIAERVATDFVQEASEWSVLYSKEVSEP